MSTPIQTIYTYLNDAGLFGNWTGPDATTQTAPTVQMRLLEETDADNDERILLIKSVSAGGGNRFVSDPVFVFAVLGKVGEPAVYAETYAELIYEALLGFEHDGCIIAIDPMGGVNGAYKTESGRPTYDTEWMVQVDSGVIL